MAVVEFRAMSDTKLNQSDFPVDLSVIGNVTGQKFLGEQTLQQSPAPLAFSTVTQNRKPKASKVQDNECSFLKYPQLAQIQRSGKIRDLLTDVSMHPLQISTVKLADNSFGEIEKRRMNSSATNNDKSVDGELQDESSLGLLSMDKMGDCSFGDVSMAPVPGATSLRSFYQSKRDIRMQSILEESVSSTKSEPVVSNRAPNATIDDERQDVIEKNALSMRYLLPTTNTSWTSYAENNDKDIGGAILKDFMKDISMREKLNFDETGNFIPLAASNGIDAISINRAIGNSSMNVDFRDDQISARSSSLGSSQRTVGTVGTFTSVFKKYSLGDTFHQGDLQLTAELPSYLRSDANFADSRMEKTSGNSKDTASTIKAMANAESLSKSSSANVGEISPLVFGKSLSFGGGDLQTEFEKINDNEEFVNAEDFHKGLDAVERECVHEHRFLQEEDMDGDNYKQNSSWMFNASVQDITRPSWMSSLPDEGGVDLGMFPQNSRVSAGQLFGARTEAMGTLDDNCDSSTKRPTFGIVPPNYQRRETQTNTKCDTVAEVETATKIQKEIEKYLGPESTPSRSFLPMGSDIADMIHNASVSNDTMTMANMALRLLAGNRNEKPKQVGPAVEKTMSTSVATATVPPSVRPKEGLRNRRSSRGPPKLSAAKLQERTESSSLSRLCPDAMQHSSGEKVNVANLTLVESNYSSDYSRSVTVGEDFDGPSHCCVGATSTFRISVNNHSNEWHRGRLVLIMLLVDDNVKLPDPTSTCVTFPPEFTVQPYSSETLKITFVPSEVGKWSITVGFNILPSEESSTLMTIVRTLQLVVVTPQIEVKPIVHFGDVPTGCCCLREVVLHGVTPASVPVKVFIEGDSSVKGSFFFFPKTDSQFAESVKVCSPNCITCDVPGNLEKEMTGTKIVIGFKTISSTNAAEELKMETCNVRVDLDSSENAVTLATVKLKAVVGAVRLHANIKSEPIVLVSTYPNPAATKFSLTNSSKIPLVITLGYVENCGNFYVSTQEMTLNAQQQFDDLVVIFRPRSGSSVSEIMESTLRLQVQPSGPIFKIKVVGKIEQFGYARTAGQVEVLENQRRTGTPPSPPVKGDSNYSVKRPERESANSKLGVCKISLNPDSIIFPDTKCGSSSVQKLKVTNKSSADVKLTLLPPEEGSFIATHTNLICKAMHFLTVKIQFRPKTVGPVHGHVVVIAAQEDGDIRMEATMKGVAV